MDTAEKASTLPGPNAAPINLVHAGVGEPHSVCFYHTARELTQILSDYVCGGVELGEPVLLIVRAQNWNALLLALQAKGLDVERECARGAINVLDAQSLLSCIMRGAMPDPELFLAAVRPAVQRCRGNTSSSIRAFGEMVDILRCDGNARAAIRLEELWNEYRRGETFSLLCAYNEEAFQQDFDGLRQVCRSHTHVTTTDGLAACASEPMSVPAHELRALVAEIACRKESEHALRESLDKLTLAERALRSHEEELRDFFENATVALHWVGPDGTILWANRAELELLGYSKDEYIGRPISEFHADPEAIADILARLGRRETLSQVPCRLRAKDGSIKHVVVSSSVYERDGRFVHTRCFTLDVTQQRQTEAEREAAVQQGERLLAITAAMANAVSSEQVYEAIVDNVAAALGASTAALWVQSPDGAYRLMRSIGYTEAVLARFQVLSDVDPTPAFDAIRHRRVIWLDSPQQLLASHAELAAAPTQLRSCQICCLPLIIGDDRCHGALGFTFEHTPLAHDQQSFLTLVARYAAQALERLRLLQSEQHSRARAERAAGRAELLYELARALMSAERVDDVFECGLDAIAAAFGTGRSAVLVFDEHGVMRFRAWRNLSDTYRDAVDGHSPWSPDERDPQPVLVSDVALDPSLSAYMPLFAAEQIGALGFIPLVATGRLIGKFMVYYEGRHAFGRDEIELATAIANHFAAAIARFQMIAALQNSVRFNEMFTGMLGHDLRNPLGAIVTAAHVAMDRQTDPRIAKPLTRILSSGDRMARMIDHLLDFTRVRVGKGIPLYLQTFDIEAGLRQVLEEFEDAYRGWSLRMTVRGDLNGRWDGDRLLQVFSNLIANAIQHGVMAHGVDINADGTAPDAVSVEIHNMASIPESLLASVFEPMTGGERRQNNSRGLGLGLFISREIVRAHHGRIDVCSSDAEGTTFRMLLPRDSTQELAGQ